MYKMRVFTTKEELQGVVAEWTTDEVNEGRRLSYLCGTTTGCSCMGIVALPGWLLIWRLRTDAASPCMFRVSAFRI